MHADSSTQESISGSNRCPLCGLQEVRLGASHALAAPIARVIALLARAELGLLSPPFHEPFRHAMNTWEATQLWLKNRRATNGIGRGAQPSLCPQPIFKGPMPSAHFQPEQDVRQGHPGTNCRTGVLAGARPYAAQSRRAIA